MRIQSSKLRRIVALVIIAAVVVVVAGILTSVATRSTAPARHNLPPVASEPPFAPRNATTRPVTPIPGPYRVAIYSLTRRFVAQAYDLRYNDRPGQVDRRVASLITPDFQGVLPEPPSPESNAGAAIAKDKTVSLASVANDSDIVLQWLHHPSAAFTVTVTRTTTGQSESAPVRSTFVIQLQVTYNGRQWRVSQLSEGAYGT